MKAPTFSLPDQTGTIRTLSDYAGKWVVLYFYPKDMTPGCTQEACDFRDNIHRITARGAVVLGVSADDVRRHQAFIQKESLNFPLLSDTDHTMCEAYGVWQKKKFMGRIFDGIVRTTMIISPTGEIAHRFDHVSVKGHVDAVLQELEALSS
jgi:peroxiredoxin Q/BCP